MEFTNHLKKCKGLQVETAIAAMGKIHQQSVQTNGLRELLADASRKAGDLKTALDKAIKRLS